MATQTETLPVAATSRPSRVLLPAYTLWLREVVRFYRQKSRVVGVVASPVLFWIVIGSGFGTSFRYWSDGVLSVSRVARSRSRVGTSPASCEALAGPSR